MAKKLAFLWVGLLATGLGSVSARAELKPESSLRIGAGYGTGPLNDFGTSLNASLAYGVPAGSHLVAGFELGGDGQHIHKKGPQGQAPYIAKVNIGHVGIWAKTYFPLSEYLEVAPIVGMGLYQVNAYERHVHFDAAGNSVGHTEPMPLVDTTNYFGGSVGMQVAMVLRPGWVVGPEVRYHLMTKGGAISAPSFLTVAFVTSARY
jgi:hypothetical protein